MFYIVLHLITVIDKDLLKVEIYYYYSGVMSSSAMATGKSRWTTRWRREYLRCAWRSDVCAHRRLGGTSAAVDLESLACRRVERLRCRNRYLLSVASRTSEPDWSEEPVQMARKTAKQIVISRQEAGCYSRIAVPGLCWEKRPFSSAAYEVDGTSFDVGRVDGVSQALQWRGAPTKSFTFIF